MQIARQNSDNDDELQQLIGEFNLKRMAFNNEAAKMIETKLNCNN